LHGEIHLIPATAAGKSQEINLLAIFFQENRHIQSFSVLYRNTHNQYMTPKK
jgi:hypothetical protein